MAINLKTYEENYYINSYEVPYTLKKGGDIHIKPILVKDYNLYNKSKQILEIRKNEINDPTIISMSYLDFIIEILFNSKDKTLWIFYFLQIMKLCLGEENISFGKDKGKNCILICNEDETVRQIISSKEFNDISKIILSQNDINYDDRNINPEVREMAEQYYKIKYKNIATPSFEKKKAFVSSKIGKTFSELNEIPYREFELLYNACKDSEIYIGQKIIQGSYKYDVKEDIKHPLFEEKKDFLSEVFSDTSTLAQKGINGSEQLVAMNFA